MNNPFYGPQAAFVYVFLQKGASQEEVVALDKGLQHYAGHIKNRKEWIFSTPGAGAAGMGGLLPFLQATLKPGIDDI